MSSEGVRLSLSVFSGFLVAGNDPQGINDLPFKASICC